MFESVKAVSNFQLGATSQPVFNTLLLDEENLKTTFNYLADDDGYIRKEKLEKQIIREMDAYALLGASTHVGHTKKDYKAALSKWEGFQQVLENMDFPSVYGNYGSMDLWKTPSALAADIYSAMLKAANAANGGNNSAVNEAGFRAFIANPAKYLK